MTILSLPAVARVAERHVRQTGPQPPKALLTWLTSIDISRERAEAGLRLATTCGRLELARHDNGPATYRLPQNQEHGA